MSAIAWEGIGAWREEEDDRARDWSAWDAAYGSEWGAGLEQLVDEARRSRIALEVGSAELLISAAARALGVSPLSASLARSERNQRKVGATPRPGSWILRTSPGARARAQEIVENVDGLGPIGRHPAIQIEESVAVLLPFLEGAASAWPGREAWVRAFLLVDGSSRSSRRRGEDAIVPGDFGALVSALATAGRASRPGRVQRTRDDVLVHAVDLLRAALAWDSDRASYWRAREALGFADGERRGQWIASARRWGLSTRDLAPSSGNVFPVSDSKSSRPSGGGKVPILPLTVIAHDSRHAASHSLACHGKDRRS